MRNHFLTAFVFTNGRSSYRFCKQSIDEQANTSVETIDVRDMKLIDGYNYITKSKKMNVNYVLKIDDDFIFHKHAFNFMESKIKKYKDYLLYSFRLWDIKTKRRIQSVKIYNIRRLKTVGIGFRANKEGKVDGLFLKAIECHPLNHLKDRSLVALHAQCPRDDVLLQSKAWGEPLPKDIDEYPPISLSEQYRDKEKIIDSFNKKFCRPFWIYMNENNLQSY